MISPELIEAAKRDLEKIQREQKLAKLSPEDCDLLRRYPRHTLAAARLIDSMQAPRVPLPDHVIHQAGEDFQFLQWQEHGTPYSRQ